MNTMGDAMAKLQFFRTADFEAVWGKVPADKRPFYEGAFRVLCAARDFETLDPGADKTGDAVTWFVAGNAERLICAVESMCRAFGYEQEVDGKTVTRTYDLLDDVWKIGEWLASKGWRTARRNIRLTWKDAMTAWKAGVALREARKASSSAGGRGRR